MSNNTIATRRRGATDRAAHKANMRLHHFLNARFWRGHGVHSPFVYHIVRHVISGRHNDQDIRKAAALYRHSLLADKTAIVVGSIGAIIRPRANAPYPTSHVKHLQVKNTDASSPASLTR